MSFSFGKQNTGFGTQNTTNSFGSQNTGGFGAQQGTTTGFGQPTTQFGQNNTGFGQQTSGFGQPNTGGFGQQNTSGFGQQNTGFGAQKPATTGFGQQNNGFGQQNTGFGQQNTGFGQQNTGFGQQNTGFGQQNTGFSFNQNQQQQYQPQPTQPAIVTELLQSYSYFMDPTKSVFIHPFYNLVHPNDKASFGKPPQVNDLLYQQAQQAAPDENFVVAFALGPKDVQNRLSIQSSKFAELNDRVNSIDAEVNDVYNHISSYSNKLEIMKKKHLDLIKMATKVLFNLYSCILNYLFIKEVKYLMRKWVCTTLLKIY